MTTRARADLLVSGARFVLVCDDAATTLPDTSVVVTEGRIIEVGPAGDVDARYEAARTVDARGHLLMPGLVNLHTHLPMTLLRGVAEDLDLQGFLRRVWAEEARIMDPEGTELGATVGALEALLGGTTTALDMYFFPDAAHRGAVRAGMRHVTGPVFFSFPGPDNLDWAARMEFARRWPQIVRESGGPYVPLALMPHAMYTVEVEHLRQIGVLAREQGALVHTHCAENHTDVNDTVAARGRRPVGCLVDAEVMDLAPILAHAVHLTAGERAEVAAADASVAHCPGSNLKLASGAADLVRYRREGITVGLGTDGCSSSNDLDMFAVMRLSANLARLVSHDPAPISAQEIVRAATLDGARALGMADRIGSVEVGKEADLILVDTRVPHLTPLREPHTALVFAAGRADVRTVIVAGHIVVQDGHSTRVDEATLLAQAEALVARSGT